MSAQNRPARRSCISRRSSALSIRQRSRARELGAKARAEWMTGWGPLQRTREEFLVSPSLSHNRQVWAPNWPSAGCGDPARSIQISHSENVARCGGTSSNSSRARGFHPVVLRPSFLSTMRTRPSMSSWRSAFWALVSMPSVCIVSIWVVSTSGSGTPLAPIAVM